MLTKANFLLQSKISPATVTKKIFTKNGSNFAVMIFPGTTHECTGGVVQNGTNFNLYILLYPGTSRCIKVKRVVEYLQIV